MGAKSWALQTWEWVQAMAHNLLSDLFQWDVIHLVIYYFIPFLIADMSWILLSDVTD